MSHGCGACPVSNGGQPMAFLLECCAEQDNEESGVVYPLHTYGLGRHDVVLPSSEGMVAQAKTWR